MGVSGFSVFILVFLLLFKYCCLRVLYYANWGAVLVLGLFVVICYSDVGKLLPSLASLISAIASSIPLGCL